MIKRLILAITILLLGYVGLFFLTNWATERIPSTCDLTPRPAYAVICFLKGERTSGMYKICYYDCLGDTVAITIKSTQLCPLTINR